jgi:hypothetical protein
MTINLSKGSRSRGRDLKLGPPEYEAGMLFIRQLGTCGIYELFVVAQAEVQKWILLLRSCTF